MPSKSIAHVPQAQRRTHLHRSAWCVHLRIAYTRSPAPRLLFLVYLEKAANRYETWIEERAPGLIAAMRQMMKQMAAQASKAA